MDVDACTSVSMTSASASESPTAVATIDIKFAAAGDIFVRGHRNALNRCERSVRNQVPSPQRTAVAGYQTSATRPLALQKAKPLMSIVA
jgi:hypothetical protein